MKRPAILCVLTSLFLCVRVSIAGEFILVKDADANCVIVVPAEKAMVAWFSAGDLQRHIKLITGVEVPVLPETADLPAEAVKIFVGNTTHTRAAGLDGDSLSQQEFIVRCEGDDQIYLLGRDLHLPPAHGMARDMYDPESLDVVIDTQNGWCGTAYATHEFLERFCDVRWLHPGALGTCYEARGTLSVYITDIQRKPAIEYRTAPFGGGMGMWPEVDDREMDLFRIRNKLGGQGRSTGHGMYGYNDRFGAKPNPDCPQVYEGYRPDFFATYRDTNHGSIAMCYSSTGLIEQVAKDAITFFKTGKRQHRDVVGPDYYHIMPQDVFCDCECETCSTRRGPLGPKGEIDWLNNVAVWSFTDAVARRVAEECPGKFISQCAYFDYAGYPDGLDLATNILCGPALHIRTGWVNMDNPEINEYRKWVKNLPGRMNTIWVYPCFPNEGAESKGYKCFPGFFARHVARFYRMFAEDGVPGIMNCGGGELIDAYAMIKYMDDVAPDEEAFLEDVVRDYYGAAAGPVLTFHREAEDVYWDLANYPGGQFSAEEAVAWSSVGTTERMERWQGLMNQAKALAVTEPTRQRVELLLNGIWTHMRTGHDTYHFRMEHQAEVDALRAGPPRELQASRIPMVEDGDPAKVDWSGITVTPIMRTTFGYPSQQRSADARFAHDGRYLFVSIDDYCDGDRIEPAADLWFWGKRWELFFGASREEGAPYRQVGIMPLNRVLYWTSDKSEFAERVRCHVNKDAKGWYIRLSIPLEDLSADKVIIPGAALYLNLIGPAWGGEDVLALSPLTVPNKYHDMPRAAKLTLGE